MSTLGDHTVDLFQVLLHHGRVGVGQHQGGPFAQLHA